jgi:hypothetical protein
LSRVNSWLDTYSATIEAVGIITGLLLLAVTAWYTKLTRDLLEFTREEFYASHTPTWSFEITHEPNQLQLVSRDANFILQGAKVVCPDEELNNPLLSAVEPPGFQWNGAALLEKELRKDVVSMLPALRPPRPATKDAADPYLLVPAGNWYYPLAFVVHYAHLGRSFLSTSIYQLQYEYSGPVQEEGNAPFSPDDITIKFRGLHLLQTLDTVEDEAIHEALSQHAKQLEAMKGKPVVVLGE